MGKSHVAPRKVMTVPRLELTAAVTSLKVSKFLQEEMTYTNVKSYFWIDSNVVLGYINNDAHRFHIFVANRVQKIRESSEPKQWRYVATEENPADHASRGLYIEDLINSNWFEGPSFLWKEIPTLEDTDHCLVDENDCEVREVTVNYATVEPKPVISRLNKFSDWNQAITAITALKKCSAKRSSNREVTRQDGERFILRMIQEEYFEKVTAIKAKKSLPKNSRLQRLNPFLDENSILRVGGRLQKSSQQFNVKHPVILPKSGHLVDLLIRHCHQKVAHQGRGFTINEIRSR